MPDIHFRAWGKRLEEWWRGLLKRWWWVVLVVLYKIAEDRILGEFNDQLDGQQGLVYDAARRVVDVLPYLTWLLVPFAFVYLLRRSYIDSKPTPAIQEMPRVSRRATLEHDGMEWEYGGFNNRPLGPFCLDDHTPLAFVDTRTNISSQRVVPYYDKAQAHMGGYWGYLQCLTCEREYGQDVQSYKTVGQSEDEVRRKFEGMENRGEV